MKMKDFWHASLMVNSFLILPVTFIAFIYSIGVMVLLGNVFLFVICLAAFSGAVILQWVFGTLVEW
jgi:hypothetical protein